MTFHTNDEAKDNGMCVSVLNDGRTIVAAITDHFGHFDDHSDAGPFTLMMVRPVGREGLKMGRVEIHLAPPVNAGGDDTWRFNFLLDLLFSDGAHLLARATGLELGESLPTLSFGIE
jgi:hypothetical protein